MKTFVIAEAGANHDRDISKAKRLICAAATSGASAVKFQLYESKTLYAKSTPDFGAYQDIPSLIRSLELPKSWLKELKSFSDDCGIEFMCTPFDDWTLDDVVSAGVKVIKVSAFESTDPRFMERVGSTGLPVIFSAGIGSSFDTVVQNVYSLQNTHPTRSVTVLHCNSAYPTPVTDINLGQMILMRSLLDPDVRVGLSDHTKGILIPPVAVSHGAAVIEKHFTLDRRSKGPDHPFAIEPDELYRMCRHIDDVEKAFSLRTRDTPSESSGQMNIATRSVVTSRSVSVGEMISPDSVTTMRPLVPGSVPAHQYFEVIDGRHSFMRDMPAGEILMQDDVGRR